VTELLSTASRPRAGWGRTTRAVLAFAVLLVGTDLLVWQVLPPGLNLALVFAAIGIALLALSRARRTDRSVVVTGIVWAVSLLPLIEAPSLIGVLVALTGTSLLALATARCLPRRFEDLTGTLLRFGVLAPFRLPADLLRLLAGKAWKGLHGRLLRGLLTWLVPVGFALAFLLLFSAANPVIEDVLRAIRVESTLDLLQPWRVALWVLVGAVLWPLLRPRLLGWPKQRQMQGPVRPSPESLLFGRAAILRSLIVFNLLFAVQTVMDVLYLWGGVRLPDGLSYADYAHRGAYPLIATALLAAGFVLVALRPGGPAQEAPLIRQLVYVWIGQNVLLVISSILRLDLYVQVYSLTEMRVAAGIWMGLVAVGLVLILLRILWRRSNAWLITSNLAALGLTLFVTAFVDFSAVIAQFNVENSRELGGKGQSLDLAYLWELGPSALPAVQMYLAKAQGRSESDLADFRVFAEDMTDRLLAGPVDWRSWSFRWQRLSDWARSIGPEIERRPDAGEGGASSAGSG